MCVNNFVKAIFVLMMAFLSACASVPMSTPEADAEAKQFLVPKDKGRIYVYRNESLGAAVTVGITVDGKMIGKTAKKVYFAIDVEPGKHTVTCSAESSFTQDVKVPAGKAVYIWQEMKMGLLYASCALNVKEETIAQQEIRECKRAAPLY